MNLTLVAQSAVCGGLAPLIFDVLFGNFEHCAAYGAKEESAGPESACMSKAVLDYAARQRRTVAIESLENIRGKGSKIHRYSERNQWAFAQFASMLRYKCALRGLPLVEVDPAYTSQACSRCGSIHPPDGNQFTCLTCGHNDHQDTNAAFNIAQRGANRPTGGSSGGLSGRRWGVLVIPKLGTST
jgi:IS605 OrfB family transposase